MFFFQFLEDARWSEQPDAVELSVIFDPYKGTARIARPTFQHLLNQSPTSKCCSEAYHGSFGGGSWPPTAMSKSPAWDLREKAAGVGGARLLRSTVL